MRFGDGRREVLVISELDVRGLLDKRDHLLQDRVGCLESLDGRDAAGLSAHFHRFVVDQVLNQLEGLVRILAGRRNRVEIVADRSDDVLRIAFAELL